MVSGTSFASIVGTPGYSEVVSLIVAPNSGDITFKMKHGQPETGCTGGYIKTDHPAGLNHAYSALLMMMSTGIKAKVFFDKSSTIWSDGTCRLQHIEFDADMK